MWAHFVFLACQNYAAKIVKQIFWILSDVTGHSIAKKIRFAIVVFQICRCDCHFMELCNCCVTFTYPNDMLQTIMLRKILQKPQESLPYMNCMIIKQNLPLSHCS